MNEEANCEFLELSDSESDSESTSDNTDELDEFLKSVKATLQMGNLSEMAHDFLDDEDISYVSPVLTEEQMQSILDGPPPPSETPPHPKRRKLPGPRRVKRSLESLFEFNIFKERAEDLYEIELMPSHE